MGQFELVDFLAGPDFATGNGVGEAVANAPGDCFACLPLGLFVKTGGAELHFCGRLVHAHFSHRAGRAASREGSEGCFSMCMQIDMLKSHIYA